MKASFKLAINAALLSGMALAAATASASDKQLLDTLLQNGVLTKAQHEKLISQAEEKPSKMTSSSLKDMDWASRIKLSGDMRVRQEFRNSDLGGVEKSRQRIRARLAINAKINDEVDAGMRIVTAGGTTSTNQSLGDYNKGVDSTDNFAGKNLYIDRAFIDWHPAFASGAHLIAGKMKQPWYQVSGGLVWDSDVNPEGLAITYERKVGSVALKATAGYFLLSDGATTTGNDSFSDDMNMYHAGISGKMKFNDSVTASLGYNAYIYNNTRNDFGNDTGRAVTVKDVDENKVTSLSAYRLHEVSGAIDIKTSIVPIKIYGQYVVNTADVRNPTTGNIDDQDSAWLAGVAAKYGAFKLDYNYRNVQRDGVMPLFNDSDFYDGIEAVRGHTLKASYKISRNFSVGAAYFAADGYNGNNRDTAQIDLKAKF